MIRQVAVLIGALAVMDAVVIHAADSRFSRGASAVGTFPGKCDGGEILRRHYFRPNTDGFSSPVPRRSRLFEPCRFSVSIRGDTARYSYKHCWSDGYCRWISSRLYLDSSSHSQAHGRCGYAAYFGSMDAGVYVCWFEDRAHGFARQWRTEAASGSRRRSAGAEYRSRRPPARQPHRSRPAGARRGHAEPVPQCRGGSTRAPFNREIQFSVAGFGSEHWFCIEVPRDKPAIEVHLYVGPKLAPGVSARSRGHLGMDLFRGGKRLTTSNGHSGQGGHHYTAAGLFDGLKPGKHTLRVTNRLLKQGRGALYIMGDGWGNGFAERDSPVSRKYRAMD